MKTEHQAVVEIRGRQVVWVLGGVIALLSVLHIVTQWARYHAGYTGLYGLTDLHAMQREGNVPTFFAVFQLLLASALLGWTAVLTRSRGDGYANYWRGLSLVFLFLAVDEASSIHELTIRPMHQIMDGLAGGLLYWPWVIPGVAFVLLLATIYIRWFFALPADTRGMFVLSALLFLGGAVVIEMFEARHVEALGKDNFGYSLFVWFEESLELAGVLVFIHGIMRHIERLGGGLHLAVVGMGNTMSNPAAVSAPHVRPAHATLRWRTRG